MPTYIITATPIVYGARPVTHTVEGIKARNKWLKLYKENKWRTKTEKA